MTYKLPYQFVTLSVTRVCVSFFNHCHNSRDLECVFFSTLFSQKVIESSFPEFAWSVFFSTLFSPVVIESSFPYSWPPTPFLLLPGQHHIYIYIIPFFSLFFLLVVDIHVCIATVSIPALHGCDDFLNLGYFCLPLC